MGKRLRHSHPLGVAAITIAAGRLELLAKIFVPTPAKLAVPACRKNPGDSDAVTNLEHVGSCPAGFDPANDLMAQNNGQRWRTHPPLDFVEFRMADTAHAYLDQNLSRGRCRVGPICRHKRQGAAVYWARFLQQHRTHCRLTSCDFDRFQVLGTLSESTSIMLF